MPANDRRRTHDQQGGTPAAPERDEVDPERPVAVLDRSSRDAAVEDDQLLPECQVLGDERSTVLVNGSEEGPGEGPGDQGGSFVRDYRA